MKKIPNIFVREADGNLRLGDWRPECLWVAEGEGVATRKWDGTACMVRGGALYKRYDAKHGKVPPADFEPCQDPDPATGHWPGWVPVDKTDPGSKWHWDAWKNANAIYGADKATGLACEAPDGTYELCGPKVSKNGERLSGPLFVMHGIHVTGVPNRSAAGLEQFLETNPWEGLVFHHPDGRMAKIRRPDYDLPWPVKP